MSTQAVTLTKIGFNSDIKLGDVIKLDNREAIIIKIYGMSWSPWRKESIIECDAVVQFVDSTDESLGLQEQAEMVQQYKANETTSMFKPNDLFDVKEDGNHCAYYQIKDIVDFKYSFVDLVVTYKAELIQEWPKYKVDRAVQANRRSNFTVIK
ncbi:hypothetical protein [Latilactobacillus phage TMW 1.1447 P1]|uniref:hypothetical protein n=1 Tax=Latilactobacillus curvatus TaxID=28038 RepID=UPI002410B34F|nr:hypothetical protein [Latilactobacillus curvatus]MDG2983079.1 hypothetical protein [Latilactobacillus curvatus]WEU69693.1 hypothetical protein [Latilactobacillus phage TMW 1.1447 P1]